MKTHTLVQRTHEWYAHRAQHFNASDAAAMLGVSPLKTRGELLLELHTGVAREFSDYVQEHVIDPGNAFEALALPFAEAIVGEPLYPVVGTLGKLSASFDGITMAEDTAYEHKRLNAALRECMSAVIDDNDPALLPLHHQVQMEQQCMVSGAGRVLFLATEFDADGKMLDHRACWYKPQPELAARITAGWAQFAEDLANYVLQPAVAPKPTAATIEALPALVVKTEGRIVSSNLGPFRDAAMLFLSRIKTDLQTDQDFVDADRTVKFCEDGEKRLELVKAQSLEEMADVGELHRTIDTIKETMRATRLKLSKLVDERKVSIRTEIVAEAHAALREHVAKLNGRLGHQWVAAQPQSLFGEAAKGKRTVETTREACNLALANAKIAANEQADRFDANAKALTIDGKDWMFLFADFQSPMVGGMEPATFKAVAESRINAHEARVKAEADRVEAARVAEAARVERQRVADAALKTEIAASTLALAPAQRVEYASVREAVAANAPKPATFHGGDEAGTLNAGQIAQRLGFALTVDFISGDLGTPPATTQRRATLWTEAQFAIICRRLIVHVQTVQAVAQRDAVAA
ncbi:MAG TPA: YqaJ viral recombinase family protein [Burkholderiaceae bacterium]|nr:YqaJ viral recombinase family protein [Burkholderiaceae bacterium]